MSDWQIGDLALCVGPLDPDDNERGMFKGRAYTVSAYFPASSKMMVLHFLEPTRFDPWEGWNPECFVKVTPPEADAFDRETIELEQTRPVREPVGMGT